MDRIYRVNSPDVVAEVIDGEAVIVNLSNGMYYSLDGAGALIWALLADHVAAEQVVATIQRQYVGDADEIERSIGQLLDELQREQLLVPATGEATDGADILPMDHASAPEPFTPLVLNKYADMEDLLLVDPVHGNIIHVEANDKDK